MLELFPGTTYQIGKLTIRPMITSKAQMLRIMKDCDGADTLTRDQKFQVFCNVCDNMLKQGRMTKATHKRFTEIW
jgi:hypothetical protein